MNYTILITTILLAGFIFSGGCTSVKQVNTSGSTGVQPATTSSVIIPAPDAVEKTNIAQPVSESESSQSISNPSSSIEKSSDMAGFISTSFPAITEKYIDIKKSRNALDWKKVQEQALSLQIQIQNLKKSYLLDVPNPEKTVFPNLNSREQIVFLKYVGYLHDMESYATNLKSAVYYQEKGGDSESLQTARRYQNLADQFEKQAIAEVKTISDYSADFKYTYINPVSVQAYRYV
jgi:hypothetical protein